MEYIETTIGNLAKFSNYLEECIKKHINESLEREDILKPFVFYKKVITIISKNYKKKIEANVKEYFDNLLNDIYTSLRKIHITIYQFTTGSLFSNDKNLKSLKDCCIRNEILIRDIYSNLKGSFDVEVEVKVKGDVPNNTTEISKKKKDINIIKSKRVFLLNIKNQRNIPATVENIFVNLIQYKDKVYYIQTNDIFNFFYFFRTEEGVWFWSPPRKTDPEDMWVQVPGLKVGDGFWKDKKIPNYMEQFIIWLDIFNPNIPEFYLPKENKEEEVEEKQNPTMVEKKDKCVIF
jgi:hypothetical protein